MTRPRHDRSSRCPDEDAVPVGIERLSGGAPADGGTRAAGEQLGERADRPALVDAHVERQVGPSDDVSGEGRNPVEHGTPVQQDHGAVARSCEVLQDLVLVVCTGHDQRADLAQTQVGLLREPQPAAPGPRAHG